MFDINVPDVPAAFKKSYLSSGPLDLKASDLLLKLNFFGMDELAYLKWALTFVYSGVLALLCFRTCLYSCLLDSKRKVLVNIINLLSVMVAFAICAAILI